LFGLDFWRFFLQTHLVTLLEPLQMILCGGKKRDSDFESQWARLETVGNVELFYVDICVFD
jgi:hypothetical protein